LSAQPQDANVPAFELKGSRFTLSVLNLRSSDLAAIDERLAAVVAQAPDFLAQAPVVLEPAAELDSDALDLVALTELLRRHGLVPVGLRGGDEALRQRAGLAGLALLGDAGTPARGPQTPPPPTPAAAPQTSARVVDKPVRSGQQVYAEGGDLVVLGTVSTGAEVIADGSIHIYGALRGRALAGARGDESARIFCQAMEPELVSIAGCYRLFEEPDPRTHGHTAQVRLDGERLIIDAL
jgi:septum site-determining protein MinC